MPIPSYDPLRSMTEGTQAGLAVGAQMALNQYRNRDLSLRMQQLQSEQALRQMEEQQMAQNIQYRLEAHDRAIDFRSDWEKAMARVQAETMPIQVPGDPNEPARPNVQATLAPGAVAAPAMDVSLRHANTDGTMEEPTNPPALPQMRTVPNPSGIPLDVSMTRNLLPVIGKHAEQPELATANFLNMMGQMRAHQATVVGQQALQEQRIASADLNRQRIEESKARMMKLLKGDAYAPGPLQKDLDAIDKETTLNDVEKEHAKRMRIGLESKLSPQKHRPTEAEYVDKHIERFMADNPDYRGRRKDASTVLKQEYRDTFGAEASSVKKSKHLSYNPDTGSLE